MKCKNCEYFKPMGGIGRFGYCESEMIEMFTRRVSPKQLTRILIRVPDEGEVVFHVHKDFGCRYGLVK